MKFNSSKIITSGKWVIAGEHSVLRGGAAVCLPVRQFRMNWEYLDIPGDLVVEPATADYPYRNLMKLVKEQAPDLDPSGWTGKIVVKSAIPQGAGLGSSAAFCVSLVRWLGQGAGWDEGAQLAMATRLENHFHGTSSGMDVATVFKDEPIVFQKEQGARPLKMKKLPHFTFHDTGERCSTKDCIARIQELRAEDPKRMDGLDQRMGEAASLAEKGLTLWGNGNVEAGESLIAEAMHLAQECFIHWQLVPDRAVQLAHKLLSDGALAVKLTGSGGGGFLVALWETRSRHRAPSLGTGT